MVLFFWCVIIYLTADPRQQNIMKYKPMTRQKRRQRKRWLKNLQVAYGRSKAMSIKIIRETDGVMWHPHHD